MTPLRLNCLVPGCRRTRGQHKGEPPIRGHEEWICADHWRPIPALRRRAYRRAVRRLKAMGDRVGAGRQRRLCVALWRSIKRTAIERAAGL